MKSKGATDPRDIRIDELETLGQQFQQELAQRKHAQIMAGSLDVRSQIGVGSAFIFRLPVQVIDAVADSPVQGRSRVVGLQSGQGDVRILVAEDVEVNRRLLRGLLAPLGLEMREAVDGREAVRICRDWRPHLVWMDMRMPRLNGYQTTRRIKDTETGADTCVVALTASAFEDDRRRVLDAGCDDFVRKPFRDQDIFGALERHLRIRFTYAEDLEAPDRGPTLTPADLAGLPEALVSRLHRAATQADEDTILAILEELTPSSPAVAEGLSTLVHDFRYDEIMDLVQERT